MSDYEWKTNLCCVATYKTLEGDTKMDQFEEGDIPFDGAKSVQMQSLRYYPKTTNNPDIIEMISFEVARKFLKLVVRDYSVIKEKSQISSADIIIALASIFRSKEATIKDLAETADSLIKFSDE
jgi:hypothetical protein